MSGELVFRPGERERISACHDAASQATEACALAMPSRGEMHAGFHRWLIRRVRRGTPRRPRHADMAALLLGWCRDRGRIDLFALCPFALALDRIHGQPGLAAAASGYPALREAWSLLDDLPGSTPRSAAARRAAAPGEGPQAAA